MAAFGSLVTSAVTEIWKRGVSVSLTIRFNSWRDILDQLKSKVSRKS